MTLCLFRVKRNVRNFENVNKIKPSNKYINY